MVKESGKECVNRRVTSTFNQHFWQVRERMFSTYIVGFTISGMTICRAYKSNNYMKL